MEAVGHTWKVLVREFIASLQGDAVNLTPDQIRLRLVAIRKRKVPPVVESISFVGLQSIYGPPSDGAIAVNHAATTPPRRRKPWKVQLGGPEATGLFYAKGLFAWRPVSAPAPSPERERGRLFGWKFEHDNCHSHRHHASLHKPRFSDSLIKKIV
jgi:hypothetical protein